VELPAARRLNGRRIGPKLASRDSGITRGASVIEPRPTAGRPFAERYLLARFPTGGVVVDLVSGNYFRVNSSAALICAALSVTANRVDARARVSGELNISPEEATRAIDDVIAGLSASAVHHEIQGAYHFYPAKVGYGLWHGDKCVLEVDGDDFAIRLAPGAETAPDRQLELYVRAVVPKLLSLRGATVLHASACTFPGKLIGFAGFSGAGKTTAARAFRDAGAQLLSEDLVVVAVRDNNAAMFVEGEAFIQSWARRAAVELHANPRMSLCSHSLVGVVEGSTARLDQILCLDRDRRTGGDFNSRPLEAPEALTALMTHDFLGGIEPETWRRFFTSALALVRVVDVREGWAPDGVERLLSAAARYISRTAS
jgi:hypothetical protein